MALTNTLLQDARVAFELVRRGEFQHAIQKDTTNYGILKAGIKNSPLLIPGYDINREKMASSHTVQLPYYDREANGAATVRGNTAALGGTTQLQAVTTSGFREEIKISDLENYENDINRMQHLGMMMMQKVRNLKDRIETYLATQIEAARSQEATNLYTYPAEFAWDGVTDFEYSVDLANQDNYWRHVRAMSMRNMLGMNYGMVGSPEVDFNLSYIANQGQGNSTNIPYSVAGLSEFEWSNAITNAAGERSNAYLYRPGAFGVQFWVNKLHANGRSNGYQQWGTMNDPDLGFNIEVYTEKGKTDTSGTITGGQLDYTEDIVLFAEVSFVGQPADANNKTDIYKIVQLTT